MQYIVEIFIFFKNNNNNLFTYSARVPLRDAHRRITHYKNKLITKFTILAYKMVQQTMHN